MVNMTVWRRKMEDAAFNTRLARMSRKIFHLESLMQKAVSVGLEKTAGVIEWRITRIKWGWNHAENWSGKGKVARFAYED